jgi:hypothetical protein
VRAAEILPIRQAMIVGQAAALQQIMAYILRRKSVDFAL